MTTSASAAASLARWAKQSSTRGQCLPRHSGFATEA